MSIELKNIVKIYNNSKTKAINDLSLEFPKGRTIGLLGINGSGKTTTSSILAGLHTYTSGSILVDGKNVESMAQYRKKIGYCPQYPTLNELFTIYDNLYFGALYFGMTHIEAKQAIDKVVEMFDLQAYLDKLPKMLSGGYQQRVSIARALLHDPDFIILDEPTVGLDPGIRHKLWNVILNLKKLNKSILLTTHYLDEADVLCDEIYILHFGKIIHKSTKEELKQKDTNKSLEEIFINLIEQEDEKQ